MTTMTIVQQCEGLGKVISVTDDIRLDTFLDHPVFRAELVGINQFREPIIRVISVHSASRRLPDVEVGKVYRLWMPDGNRGLVYEGAGVIYQDGLISDEQGLYMQPARVADYRRAELGGIDRLELAV